VVSFFGVMGFSLRTRWDPLSPGKATSNFPSENELLEGYDTIYDSRKEVLKTIGYSMGRMKGRIQ